MTASTSTANCQYIGTLPQTAPYSRHLALLLAILRWTSRITRRGKSNKNLDVPPKPGADTGSQPLNESPAQRAGFLFLLISSAAING